jgi:hypothetical protein
MLLALVTTFIVKKRVIDMKVMKRRNVPIRDTIRGT